MKSALYVSDILFDFAQSLKKQYTFTNVRNLNDNEMKQVVFHT